MLVDIRASLALPATNVVSTVAQMTSTGGRECGARSLRASSYYHRIIKVVDPYPNLRTTSVDGEWIGISMAIAPILVLRSRHRSIFQACLQSVVCRDTRRASIPDTDEESRIHGRPKV